MWARNIDLWSVIRSEAYMGCGQWAERRVYEN